MRSLADILSACAESGRCFSEQAIDIECGESGQSREAVLSGMAVRDGRGALHLSARDVTLPEAGMRDAVAGGPSRAWIPDRATSGPVTVTYTVPAEAARPGATEAEARLHALVTVPGGARRPALAAAVAAHTAEAAFQKIAAAMPHLMSEHVFDPFRQGSPLRRSHCFRYIETQSKCKGSSHCRSRLSCFASFPGLKQQRRAGE